MGPRSRKTSAHHSHNKNKSVKRLDKTANNELNAGKSQTIPKSMTKSFKY
jgi:hypothetical protein